MDDNNLSERNSVLDGYNKKIKKFHRHIQIAHDLTMDFKVVHCESINDLDEYLKFDLQFEPKLLFYPETYVLYWYKKNENDKKYSVGCKTMRDYKSMLIDEINKI